MLMGIAAGLVLLAGMAGYGAWRLRQGPIGLAWLRPSVEASVREAQPGMALTIGSLALWWDAERRRIELRAVDVNLRHAESGQALALPAVAIHPRLLPLLRGRVELHHLTLIAPRLSLVRTEEGVTLRTAEGERDAAGAVAPAPAITALLTTLHELLTVVGFIEVRSGEISIDDQPLAHTWDLRQVRAKLHIVAARLSARADAEVHSGGLIAAVSIEATEGDGGRVDVATQVADIVPTALLHAIPAASRLTLPPALEEALGAVTSPITTEGHFALTPQGHFDGPIRVSAHGDHLSIEDTKHGLRLRDGTLRLEGAIDVASATTDIREVTIAFPDVTLSVAGTLTKLAGESRLELRGSVSRFPVAALRHYWLISIAPGARRWVTENITHGALRNVVATVQLTLGNDGRADRFELKAAFDELAVRFLPDMPPATALRGSVSVSEKESVFTVVSGRLEQLEVAAGTVRIVAPDGPAPARVDVDVDVRGPLARAVAVLDHDPVFLARNLRVSPDDLDGSMDAKVRCTVPLDDSPNTAPVISASAHLDGVALRQPINGWSIGAGRFDVRLADSKVDADGRADVATVPTSITVRHQLGRSAATSVRLQAQLDARARAALGIDLGETISGTIPLTVGITPETDAPWTIDLDADLTAAQFSPPVAALAKAAGRAGRATARVVLDGDKTMRIDRFTLDAGGTFAQGSAEHGRDGWDMVRAELRLPKTPRSGAAMVDLSAQRQGAEYALSVRSKDAGAVVDHFMAGDARGGSLVFDGSVRPNAGRSPSVQGRLDITDLEFSEAPILTRLLTLGSLSGLKSTILSEGVHFDQIHADLTHERGVIRMTDGRADGDAMALLGTGSFDTNTRQMDVNCSVIPSYYGLNTGTQKIPILGPLVSKATGEAFQVIDARVHGSFDDPTVTIAPASVVAPEIVKEQLRKWRGKPRKR